MGACIFKTRKDANRCRKVAYFDGSQQGELVIFSVDAFEIQVRQKGVCFFWNLMMIRQWLK
jgi:hypothetical protein